MTRILCFFILAAIASLQLGAQVTSSSISGKVIDENKTAVEGATIIATHRPSGTKYGVITNSEGTFFIPNMRIGGPYSIKTTHVGHANATVNNINLKLGERRNINFELKTGIDLEAVVISSEGNELINPDKTGASTVISLDQLKNFPTITRSAADLTRLNPMAAEGGSFGGRNDQFNNYSLDGSIFNNPFGLDAATPGGQTDAQPISLDAIEQISVSLAPYDVTKAGFTGASIDAVTKSGTNEITGSVFGYFRNSELTGGKVEGTEVNRGDLSQLQTGFSIGGPIVKDKVFFFANFEMERRSDLGSYFVPNSGQSGANVSRVLASDMELISNILGSEYGYETGAITGFKHSTDNEKGLLKFNFNLSEEHKLAVTYNFLNASRDLPAHPSALGRRGPDFTTLQFQNSGYTINNIIHSGKLELSSLFGSRFANKLQVGYTAFRDSRDPFSKPFPVLNFIKEGSRYIVAGHEPFSINNVLDQDVIQVTNNFNIYSNQHNLTFGTSFEYFAFNNSFNLTGYGGRLFPDNDVDIDTAEIFLRSPVFAEEVAAARAAFTTNNENDSWALAELNIGQYAVYVQDEINFTDNFRLTVGLRMDVPLYFNTEQKMQESIDRNCCYEPSIQYYDESGDPIMLNSLQFPKQSPLLSPRIGFNYDINGEGSSQLRGGSGIFTGRFPFVWIANQVGNPNSFFYVTTDPDFKFPRVWRTNIGYDKQFANGFSISADVIYTKDLQAAMVRNFGLQLPSARLEGIAANNRPIYTMQDRATNAYVFTNISEGYSFNASVQIKKTFANDFNVSLAYNYLDVKDAASIDAEISSDAYDRNPANRVHTNTAELSPSLYGNRHRIVGSLYKKFKQGERSATHIAAFLEFVQGGRYSFTYAGDINNDGSGLNDLIYIPTESELTQMNFASEEQRAAFGAFIEQDDYLSENRGSFAEKYGSINPWYGKMDVRVMQEFGLSNGDNIQFSIDILNFGNLISSSWGVRQIATNTGLVQPLGVSVRDGVPTYQFISEQTSTLLNDFSLNSRWQLQFGLRYNF